MTQPALAPQDTASAKTNWPLRHRLSVEAFHRMIEAGVFKEDDHVELIEGELCQMPPIGPSHAGKNKRLNRLFATQVGEQALVAVQDPLTLPMHSEPQPDLMLLRPRSDFYEHSNPLPADVLLLVEIAETSVQYDRQIKLPLYAGQGIPEVWLLDLARQQLEIYRQPSAEGYQQCLQPPKNQTIAPLALPGLFINVAELW